MTKRRSPHFTPTEPEWLLGPEKPAFRKAGPVLRGGEHARGTHLLFSVTYIGIDIAKERVDVVIRPSGRSWSLPYDEAEVRELVGQLQDLMPVAVIL